MSTQICSNCQKEFDYPNKEYNRRIKKGITRFFCSNSCSISYRNRTNPNTCNENLRKAHEANRKNNYLYQKSRRGNFTYYLNKARNRLRDVQNDLDENYLESIWTGRCSLSNIPITLITQKHRKKLTNASLDRIDSDKGYIKGNVQFVALGINFAKNNFSDEDLLAFIREIKAN